MDDFKKQLDLVLTQVSNMLIEKNRAYGDSALNPRRIFSSANSVEQILVRIDDKISRIATQGFKPDSEDTVMDLLGYLVLLRIAQRNSERSASTGIPVSFPPTVT